MTLGGAQAGSARRVGFSSDSGEALQRRHGVVELVVAQLGADFRLRLAPERPQLRPGAAGRAHRRHDRGVPGGRGEARPLTERDRWIAAQVGPTLREKGLLFVGLDVIGEHLTEINVTSPTCIREIDNAFGTCIAEQLMAVIAAKLEARDTPKA